jgi:hypothetical protein
MNVPVIADDDYDQVAKSKEFTNERPATCPSSTDDNSLPIFEEVHEGAVMCAIVYGVQHTALSHTNEKIGRIVKHVTAASGKDEVVIAFDGGFGVDFVKSLSESSTERTLRPLVANVALRCVVGLPSTRVAERQRIRRLWNDAEGGAQFYRTRDGEQFLQKEMGFFPSEFYAYVLAMETHFNRHADKMRDSSGDVSKQSFVRYFWNFDVAYMRSLAAQTDASDPTMLGKVQQSYDLMMPPRQRLHAAAHHMLAGWTPERWDGLDMAKVIDKMTIA